MPGDESWRAAVREALAGCASVSLEEATAAVSAALAAGGSEKHAADLALAFAVGRGDTEAAKRFDALVATSMEMAIRAIDRDPEFVDEMCQLTRVRLVVGDGTNAPRIARYRGTGSLRAWTTIAVQRVALNAKRSQQGDRTTSVDVLAELVDREPDPELQHLKKLYRSEFREALTAALASLEDRQRAVLRLRFVDGLELSEIARLYRVHGSTVSRWISASLAAIADNTRSGLVSRLSVSPATADSVARMVQSQLDLSIARLLR